MDCAALLMEFQNGQNWVGNYVCHCLWNVEAYSCSLSLVGTTLTVCILMLFSKFSLCFPSLPLHSKILECVAFLVPPLRALENIKDRDYSKKLTTYCLLKELNSLYIQYYKSGIAIKKREQSQKFPQLLLYIDLKLN